MKTEIANKKLEILNLIFKSKDGASWNEVSEMLNEFKKVCKDEAIADHEASKTVIKAKALRKKGTDKWYQIDYVALDDGNFPFRTRRLPDLWHDEYRKDGIGFVAESNLPSDAELIDIEIIVNAGGER